jgi:hypothetical protein
MLRMVLRYGPAVGAFLTLVPIIWRMVLDAIVLYSNEPDRRNRALMLRFPHLAKLDDRLPPLRPPSTKPVLPSPASTKN